MLVSPQKKGATSMKGKRRGTEQIVRILREADSGAKVSAVCRKHNISEQTFYRWRRKYGDLGVKEAKRLKELETENAKLKKLLAEAMLDIELLKEVSSKNF